AAMPEPRCPDQPHPDAARHAPGTRARAAAALAAAGVAILAGVGQAGTDAAGAESCSDRVSSWAAQMAPQTNGFNNEEIARQTAEVQRAAAAALEQC
ncbi:MAG: hypothetical protein ACT4QF_01840, partial [Sporichthyaceae bacterium]